MSRTILITGGNGGLGLAIAKAFLDQGDEVWLGLRNRRDQADELASQHPDQVHLVPLDVTRTSDWQTAIDGILQTHGRLDVLVNNAGHHDDQLLATMTDQAWHGVLQSNLDGTFYGCRAVAKAMMAERRGRIVNIASLSALLSPAGQSNYAAAKAGVIGLTQSFAKEVARAGITVNCLCPGYIETPALNDMDPDQRRAAAMRVPMRRFGKTEEIAAAVLFLASPGAAYVTGSTLKIDGGLF